MFVRIDDFPSDNGKPIFSSIASKGLTARCRDYQAGAACATKVVVANPRVIQAERGED
jgi:hypothetical protein